MSYLLGKGLLYLKFTLSDVIETTVIIGSVYCIRAQQRKVILKATVTLVDGRALLLQHAFLA